MEWCVVNATGEVIVTMSATGTGWVGSGFSTSGGKVGADIYIGYVSGGTTYLRDDHNTSGNAHAADTSQSFTLLGGGETVYGASTVTWIRYKRLLNTGDAQDITLTPGGSITIIMAYHATADDFSTHHTNRSAVGVSNF